MIVPRDVDQDLNEDASAAHRADEAAARLIARMAECVQAIAPADAHRATPPRVAALPDATRDALREELHEFASALRALDATPEHMLIRVKRLAADALDRARTSSPELMQAITTWSIEGYFSSDGRPTT